MHMVGWSKIIRPKEQGRLGIQAVKAKKPCTSCKSKLKDVPEEGCLKGKSNFGEILLAVEKIIQGSRKTTMLHKLEGYQDGFPYFL